MIAMAALCRHFLADYCAIKSSSLDNCSSIHPSTGSVSEGRPFCHRLKRSRSLLAAGAAGVPPALDPAGSSCSQYRGSLNSKFRSRATVAGPRGWPEAERDEPPAGALTFQLRILPASTVTSRRRVRGGGATAAVEDSRLTTSSKFYAGTLFSTKSRRP